MAHRTLPGSQHEQGATWDGTGVNFAIYSENATRVELCLFDSVDTAGHETIEIRECTGYVWHCYVPGLTIGQLYGYRIYGPFDPERGHRFNPSKLLIDPYARALAGQVNWEYPIFSYKFSDPQEDLSFDDRDDAAGVPKSVVTSSHFDWQNDRFPETPLHDSVIYEVHVKGFTQQMPGVPENVRGTYAGLASPAAIDYFKSLGVTAVELMPIHAFPDDKHLIDIGLHNYWGYNTTNFFSPEARYSSSGDRGQQIGEFKTMVREFHRAGIEVILDVVYNHTSEGNRKGPTLSFRGVDNLTYYRLVQNNQRYYMDYTGTGNTLNVRNPQVLKLVMGQFALLGPRHARRRVSLRSGLSSRTRTSRSRSAVGFFRRHQSGPGALESEVDCRAVGRWRRRISGGTFSFFVGRMEWEVSRRSAALLEGR